MQSGTERLVGRFTVSPQPDAEGFYTFTDEVVEDTGGVSCSDEDQDLVGDVATVYVRLSPDQQQIVICYERSPPACFGPLTRLSR